MTTLLFIVASAILGDDLTRLPSAASNPPTIASTAQSHPDGQFWNERIWIVRDAANPVGRDTKGLLPPQSLVPI
jgi:hypothetical protein